MRDDRSVWAASFALAVVVVALAPLPAGALPAQSLAEFAAWSAHRPLLAGLERKSDELSGTPMFALTTADHGIAWSFDAHSNAGAITWEQLAVSRPGGKIGSEPIRHDGSGYGFVFFRALYGRTIADDFRTSRRVAAFTQPEQHAVKTFYRGNRYGYSTMSGFMRIETLPILATDIALERRCSAEPEACSE